MAKKARTPDKVINKVYVCLNRPTGIVFKMPDGRKVRINGNGVELKGKESGVLKPGTYGMTLIDTQDWEQIKATYGGMEIFKNGLIFANESRASALDESEDKEELRNGLEPASKSQPKTEPATPGAA